MKHTQITIFALAILFLTPCIAQNATEQTETGMPIAQPAPVETLPNGSLWCSTAQTMYCQRKFQVGDLLCVDILQQSTAATSAKHATQKNSNANAEAGSGLFAGFTGLGIKADRSTNGSGNAVTSTQIVDRLSVAVTGVLPNGNLQVRGQRTMTLERDVIDLVFTGEVRPQDITPDNTIISTLVGNIKLDAKGQGSIADKQRPGIMERLLGFLW